MKRNRKIRYLVLAIVVLTGGTTLLSQDAEPDSFSTGADFYSSFIWRGSKLGTGPAIQPVVEYKSNFITAGAWGSFDFAGYQEVDLYFSLSLPAGFSFGITDYYNPDLRYFDYTPISGSHAIELNLGFSQYNFSLGANYIINEAGGVGSAGKDLYFQAGYSFSVLTLFVGAGNGWHNYDPDTNKSSFGVCNTGIEVSKTIKITDTFRIPLTGQIVFNPAQERMYVVVGFTL
ncbi:MAG: hypothetical protein WAL29_09160 [Bacteroidales bacterium]